MHEDGIMKSCYSGAKCHGLKLKGSKCLTKNDIIETNNGSGIAN